MRPTSSHLAAGLAIFGLLAPSTSCSRKTTDQTSKEIAPVTSESATREVTDAAPPLPSVLTLTAPGRPSIPLPYVSAAIDSLNGGVADSIALLFSESDLKLDAKCLASARSRKLYMPIPVGPRSLLVGREIAATSDARTQLLITELDERHIAGLIRLQERSGLSDFLLDGNYSARWSAAARFDVPLCIPADIRRPTIEAPTSLDHPIAAEVNAKPYKIAQVIATRHSGGGYITFEFHRTRHESCAEIPEQRRTDIGDTVLAVNGPYGRESPFTFTGLQPAGVAGAHMRFALEEFGATSTWLALDSIPRPGDTTVSGSVYSIGDQGVPIAVNTAIHGRFTAMVCEAP